MNPETILPCPFCGAPPKVLQREHPAIEHVTLAWVVQCSGCTAETCSEHRQWAIDYWNRRPQADWSAAAREAADQITRECGGSAGWVQKVIEKYLAKHAQSQPSPVPSQEPVGELKIKDGIVSFHTLVPIENLSQGFLYAHPGIVPGWVPSEKLRKALIKQLSRDASCHIGEQTELREAAQEIGVFIRPQNAVKERDDG